MNKKLIFGILILMVLVVAIFGVTKILNSSSVTGNVLCIEDGCNVKNADDAPVKEFTITSFTEMIDGKP